IDIEITVNKAENALAIPVNAVNRGNTVYVKGDKESDDDKAPEGYKTVNVEVGISNGQFIEVKSGLNEGDTVYSARTSSDSQSMMPGMMGGGMPGGGMPGGGMPGGGGMPSGGGNRSSGGGMPGGGAR
ncbi:MAG: efflux transporter periplasmic adaptor subunit, partial [Monoglobaceae bacterium]